MARRRIGSGSAWEERGGYSRAVVDGRRVFVAGTAPIMPDDADPPPDPYGQARRCLEIVAAALHEAGGSLDDVVRTRLLLTDASYAPEVLRAHGEAFRDGAPGLHRHGRRPARPALARRDRGGRAPAGVGPGDRGGAS